MLSQFGSDDTLVPPNLSTTQGCGPDRALKGLFVFENVAQLFL